MILGITGHRPNVLGDEYDLKGMYSDAIRKEVRRILETYRPEEFLDGFALGVDQIAAEEALDLGIPVTAAIPFKGQENMWPQKSKERYYKLLAHPLVKQVIVSEGPYSPKKLQIRNEWIVDRCSPLIAVWTGRQEGGTYNCIRYAKSKEKEIIYINPIDLIKDQVYKDILPDYGDLMSIKEFKDCVADGGFTDYDGFGYPVRGKKHSSQMIYPSQLHKIPSDATHIIWFNK